MTVSLERLFKRRLGQWVESRWQKREGSVSWASEWTASARAQGRPAWSRWALTRWAGGRGVPAAIEREQRGSPSSGGGVLPGGRQRHGGYGCVSCAISRLAGVCLSKVFFFFFLISHLVCVWGQNQNHCREDILRMTSWGPIPKGLKRVILMVPCVVTKTYWQDWKRMVIKNFKLCSYYWTIPPLIDCKKIYRDDESLKLSCG